MKLFLLTQEDAFYVPLLLKGFLEMKPAGAEVVGAAVLRGEIATSNVGAYFRLLGPLRFLQTGFYFAVHKVLDLVGRVVPIQRAYSVTGLLRKEGIPIHRPARINDASFHELLRQERVDLLISVACPQIIRAELLGLPPEGVINIHGALLPRYRGKLPSYWVLAHGEEKTGVTVHYMNEKLDDGPIIVQREIPIRPDDTLHSLILRSKVGYGAAALAEAVRKIMEGSVETIENDGALATYYSFPTLEAIRQFRASGRRIR